MSKNKLITAVAGSGKTAILVDEALAVKNENVLVTTFTRANAEEIKSKILATVGVMPRNITVQPWFSFLLQHGVRPYQTIMNPDLVAIRIGVTVHSPFVKIVLKWGNTEGMSRRI
jgi:DNA helicase-2/ATP-dependent DNA helicase PcrA